MRRGSTQIFKEPEPHVLVRELRNRGFNFLYWQEDQFLRQVLDGQLTPTRGRHLSC